MHEFRPIGSFKPKNPFMLAPMLAVNASSFRLLCEKRGAGTTYSQMIDSDDFVEYLQTHSKDETIKQFLNPLEDEKNLFVQVSGSNHEKVLDTFLSLEKYAKGFDFNAACPIGRILGKKAGAYYVKHPDMLYKMLKDLRPEIKKPFTLKIRSGWDDDSITAPEIATESEKIGMDAIAVHPRTRKQGYMSHSDWTVLSKIRKKTNDLPLILSGDVNNSFRAKKAFELTKVDYIMVGRAARANPSIFNSLNSFYDDFKNAENSQTYSIEKPASTYEKNKRDTLADLLDFIKLYEKHEARNSLDEIKDHALWLSSECKQNREIRNKILKAKSKENLISIFKNLSFS